MATTKEGGWISVKKQLPDENVDILIACDWFDIGMSAWHENGHFFFLDGEQAHNVTHWMPAPKAPPKNGRESGVN